MSMHLTSLYMGPKALAPAPASDIWCAKPGRLFKRVYLRTLSSGNYSMDIRGHQGRTPSLSKFFHIHAVFSKTLKN